MDIEQVRAEIEDMLKHISDASNKRPLTKRQERKLQTIHSKLAGLRVEICG